MLFWMRWRRWFNGPILLLRTETCCERGQARGPRAGTTAARDSGRGKDPGAIGDGIAIGVGVQAPSAKATEVAGADIKRHVQWVNGP